MENYNLMYRTKLSVNDCISSMSRTPWEYECKWGTPLWYECEKISDTQLLVIFKGGQFRKAVRTQYLMEFSGEDGETVITVRFYKESLGLPPMTPPDDIDRFMKQKIQAIQMQKSSTSE